MQTRRKTKGCDITSILNCLPPNCRMVLRLVNCIYMSMALFSHSEHRSAQVSALWDINGELFVLKRCYITHGLNFVQLWRIITVTSFMSQLDWLCIQSHILASTKNKRGHESHYAFSTLHNTLWMRKWVRVWLVLWALRFQGYDRALILSQSLALGFSRNHVESSVPCDNNTRWQRSLCSGQQATIIRPALQCRTLLIISIKAHLSKFSSSRHEIASSYEALLAKVRFSRHWSFVLWL
jgi:hypothetical protein